MNITSSSLPAVAILLCTYNGERFLAAQLESIATQSYKNWIVYASDDGSTDGTLELLRAFRHRVGESRVVILDGPQQGFSKNFLSVLSIASGKHSFYAYCDQDDVWMGDKLSRSLHMLKPYPDHIPQLYCGRTKLIDEHDQELGFSPVFGKTASFGNALVQNLAGGNTMVINNALCEVVRHTPLDVELVAHDWWTYLLVTGLAGVVVYDAEPMLKYRQHDQNVIGANVSFSSRLRRLRSMFIGTFREWNDLNILALRRQNSYLTAENLRILSLFQSKKNSTFLRRVEMVFQCGLRRQTLMGNLGLALAILINRA